MSNLEKEESNSLKYRMIGAVAVLVIAIILLSMVLDQKGAKDESARSAKSALATTQVTSKEEFISRIQPIGDRDDKNKEMNIKMDHSELPKPDKVINAEKAQAEKEANAQVQADVVGALDDTTADAGNAPVADPVVTEVEDNTEDSNTAAQVSQSDSDQADSTAANEAQAAAEKAAVEAQAKVEQAAKDKASDDAEEKASDTFPNEDINVGWVVRVGTFSNPENVQKMIDVLNKNGFQTQYEIITTASKKQATRVWVGPYQKRVTAGRAVDKIKSVTGVDPFIKAFP